MASSHHFNLRICPHKIPNAAKAVWRVALFCWKYKSFVPRLSNSGENKLLTLNLKSLIDKTNSKNQIFRPRWGQFTSNLRICPPKISNVAKAVWLVALSYWKYKSFVPTLFNSGENKLLTFDLKSSLVTAIVNSPTSFSKKYELTMPPAQIVTFAECIRHSSISYRMAALLQFRKFCLLTYQITLK